MTILGVALKVSHYNFLLFVEIDFFAVYQNRLLIERTRHKAHSLNISAITSINYSDIKAKKGINGDLLDHKKPLLTLANIIIMPSVNTYLTWSILIAITLDLFIADLTCDLYYTITTVLKFKTA